MRCSLVLTGVGVLAAFQLGSLQAIADTRPATVVIQLDDAVGLPAKVVDDAKVEVERTFLSAGVRIVWANGPSDMTRPADDPSSPRSRRLQVVIVSGPPGNASGPEGSIEGVVGTAVRALDRGLVFYRRLASASVLHPIAVSLVLGHVIAHELGHLLLPPRSHSDVGIMRQEVDFRHQAIRRFTDAQASLIRAALSGDGKEASSCGC